MKVVSLQNVGVKKVWNDRLAGENNKRRGAGESKKEEKTSAHYRKKENKLKWSVDKGTMFAVKYYGVGG